VTLLFENQLKCCELVVAAVVVVVVVVVVIIIIKLSKYKDLEFEVSRMCKVRTKIVPVVIRALRTINKGLYQNLQLLPGHLLAVELQKIILMSTVCIICKLLV
jgi:hypothetical protein